jgi:hypothetical protein
MEMVLTTPLNFLQVDALSGYASSLNNLADADLTQTNLNIVVGDTIPATASVFILSFLKTLVNKDVTSNISLFNLLPSVLCTYYRAYSAQNCSGSGTGNVFKMPKEVCSHCYN